MKHPSDKEERLRINEKKKREKQSRLQPQKEDDSALLGDRHP